MERRSNARVAVCSLLLVSEANRLDEAIVERRKRLQVCRRRAFAGRQSRERLIFMSTAVLTIHSPVVRSLWVKPKSSQWWEQVVNQMFMSYDWLENFRMSNATFLYVCNELRSTIEKNDTLIMRKAIPVEQRVTLTIWFLSTGSDFRTIGRGGSRGGVLGVRTPPQMLGSHSTSILVAAMHELRIKLCCVSF